MIGRASYFWSDEELLWTAILNADPDDIDGLEIGEVGASGFVAQDTNITQPIGTKARLRVLLNTTNATGTGNFQLEFREVGAAKWRIMEVR